MRARLAAAGVAAMVAGAAVGVAGCARNPHSSLPPAARRPDGATIVHVLNRIGFGPRAGDIERVRRAGLAAFVEQQLHPDTISDPDLDWRLQALTTRTTDARAFASRYYLPMVAARADLAAQRAGRLPPGAPLRALLMPIAALTLPGGDKPAAAVGQNGVLPEEWSFERRNQQVLQELQAGKLLRAVYSERQLEEVLVDFWFNHFNVFAGKIEDKPVMLEYERDVVRPHVLGRFRDLLGAVAKSQAMLFYLDNWLSRGGRLNENYARELMELHTLGVDGGYTQQDVVEVARAFTGWTMRKPREASGFTFDEKMHDRGEKRVLGRALKAGRGVEDGEEVLDLLARHPSTARFVASKLARRLVADDPPPSLVDRAARVFRATDGDLREVVRAILTSPEFFGLGARRAKMKTPFEFVASALRATGAEMIVANASAGTIAALGEPLYQCLPPTGYGDRAAAWVATGSLIDRLNFVQALTGGRIGGVRVNLARPGGSADEAPDRIIEASLAGDLSASTRQVLARAALARATAAQRTGLVLGAPEFQRR
jgi:uncharacterized protein (DUF1800 family)